MQQFQPTRECLAPWDRVNKTNWAMKDKLMFCLQNAFALHGGGDIIPRRYLGPGCDPMVIHIIELSKCYTLFCLKESGLVHGCDQDGNPSRSGEYLRISPEGKVWAPPTALPEN